MKDSDQRANKLEQRFRKELKNLLKKYDAEITAEDHWQGYAECGQDIRITVSISGIWDNQGGVYRPQIDIDFGRFIDKDMKVSA